MRKLLICLCLPLGLPALSVAGPPSKYERNLGPRTPLSQQLIMEREAYRGWQRTRRLETRRWLNESPARPLDRTGFGVEELFRYSPQPQPYYWYAAPRQVEVDVR